MYKRKIVKLIFSIRKDGKYRIIGSQVFGSSFFSSATDFSDEDDAFGFWVIEEDF